MATREEIWAAADAIQQAGQRPTLVAVRRAVGGGSYTTISEAMAEWRARQRANDAPLREPPPESVAVQAAELAAEIWAQALALATQRLHAERESLETARAEIERERVEAAEMADTLAGELDQARLDLKEAKEAIRDRDLQIERLRNEALDLREKIAGLEGKVAGLEQFISQTQRRAFERAFARRVSE